ncbi:MAG: AAA family ATPase [Propionibacteriaceae bacterium]|nr:AAA family ATPase [Propionibacteriaceae bacterium]
MSHNNEKNTKQELLNMYTMISPVLFLYFKNSEFFVFISIIPVIINMIIYLYENINNMFDNNKEYNSYIILNSKSIINDLNCDYICFLWWILNNNKIINIQQYGSDNYFTDTINNQITTWENYKYLSNNSKYFFIYNDIKYKIYITQEQKEQNIKNTYQKTDKSNNTYMIYLYSSNIEYCNNLLELSINEYKKYLTKISEEKRKKEKNIFYYKHIDKKLISKHIKINKNKDNTFIENNINILENVKYFLNENTKQIYKKRGQPYKLTFLLSGVPGSGKTSVIYAVSNIYNKNIFDINLNNYTSLSDFELSLNEISRQIDYGDIIVFEEIDESKSTNVRLNDPNKREKVTLNILKLGDILPIFDGYNYFDNCIIFITSNHPEKLDPAFLRPGRIDYHYKFNYCSLDLIQKIMKFYLNDIMFTEEELNKLIDIEITSAVLINTFILPKINIIDLKCADNKLFTDIKQNIFNELLQLIDKQKKEKEEKMKKEIEEKLKRENELLQIQKNKETSVNN